MSLPADARAVCFILTADRSLSQPFYAEAMGLPVLGDDQFAVTFDLGGGTTLRLTDLPGHKASEHPVLGWNVSDIRSVVAALKEKGVVFKIYEGFGQDADAIWSAPDGSAQIAWFADPEGNVLSVAQFG